MIEFDTYTVANLIIAVMILGIGLTLFITDIGADGDTRNRP